MNKKEQLYYVKEWNFIKELKSKKTGAINYRDIKDIKSSLKQKGNQFVAKFNYNDFTKGTKENILGVTYHNVEFKGSLNFFIEQMYISSNNYNTTKGIINGIRSDNFELDNSYFYKLIIPISKPLNFFNIIDFQTFKSDTNIISSNSIRINLNNENIIIISEEIDGGNFLVFQSSLKQTFEDFHSKLYSIRIALGFISGHFAGGKGYFFTYKNAEMNDFFGYRFISMRQEIRILNQPVNSNAYAWMEHDENAKKLYDSKILKRLSSEHFSNFCNLLIDNEELRSAVLLINESSEATLVLRPYGFCIALEALKEIVLVKHKEKAKPPITDKKIAKKFRSDLTNVLNKYEKEESFKDIETIKIRIDNINQQTNNAKLALPFKVMGIELNSWDEKVIESRNDLLHGRVPNYKGFNKGERSERDMDIDLWFASNKLYTLLSLLIMKYIGFDGYVINFSKKYEGRTGYLIEEPFYRNK